MIVTITDCSTSDSQWVHNSRTTDQADAIDRAVKKSFGKNARFFADSGLANLGIYGQIVKKTSSATAYRCITGRVKINIG